ncbi:aminotransferase DegT [Chryseobacterium aquaticum]|uniref:Aminotransferase DegT n=1 Tax=Chryseobacterium aquaticum TaxID=452084 RepID=A0A0Q3HWS7_9FLAO|nr:DegT/DnrJ/EryC1/StrS family aminotransferase [Chryseobacterium aquaticum]KQK27296.1 aminotransferase DegT [Chryseobacterium aquaticum]
MINVTQSFLPPIEQYVKILEKSWNKKWITNRGELILELEEKLKHFLGINFITITTNGTLPLQIAIKALNLSGEIITTPFSYIASSSVISWENCTPVYVDIDPEYLTIDESKIEEQISSKTTAILATHVFGNPCNVIEIEKIAKKHNIKVIYDAAHCFGVKYNGESIFNFGDISTCSFHATKIFHTGEGGCIITKDKELHEKSFYLHNFGHNGSEDFYGIGINAKTSELQAALGLAVFNHLDAIFYGRKKIVETYDRWLDSTRIKNLKIRENTEWNYHYYPVIFDSEETLLHIKQILNKEDIFPRRYFYPSLNTIKYLNGKKMPISESISKRILCLPLYAELQTETAEKIAKLINKNLL